MADAAGYLENEDIADLYVSAWDKNTSNSSQIVNSARINAGDRLDFRFALNGDGIGIIKWSAVRADDSNVKNEDDDVEIQDGDTVAVTAR